MRASVRWTNGLNYCRADPRFRYLGARQTTGDARWVMEAEWKGYE